MQLFGVKDEGYIPNGGAWKAVIWDEGIIWAALWSDEKGLNRGFAVIRFYFLYFKTFRNYRTVFEEQKSAIEQRYRSLLEEAIQDAVFLSATNQDLMFENQQLKQGNQLTYVFCTCIKSDMFLVILTSSFNTVWFQSQIYQHIIVYHVNFLQLKILLRSELLLFPSCFVSIAFWPQNENDHTCIHIQ
jgi:hypothetical protein